MSRRREEKLAKARLKAELAARPKRVATYIRVSSGGQSTENQIPEVEAKGASRGTVVLRYEEKASTSAKKPRVEFEKMKEAARNKEFDVLIIWAIDRFGRDMVGNLTDILDLDKLDVVLVSCRETWLDTSSEFRSMLIAQVSWMGEQEKKRIKERTVLGLARKKANREKIGGKYAPFGFKVVDGPVRERRGVSAPVKMLEEVPEEQAILAQIREWDCQKLRSCEIARKLLELGAKTRTGKDFGPVQIARIIESGKPFLDQAAE